MLPLWFGLVNRFANSLTIFFVCAVWNNRRTPTEWPSRSTTTTRTHPLTIEASMQWPRWTTTINHRCSCWPIQCRTSSIISIKCRLPSTTTSITATQDASRRSISSQVSTRARPVCCVGPSTTCCATSLFNVNCANWTFAKVVPSSRRPTRCGFVLFVTGNGKWSSIHP